MWLLDVSGAPVGNHKDTKFRDAAEMSEARADNAPDLSAHGQGHFSRYSSISHDLAESVTVRGRVVSMHPYFKAPRQHVHVQHKRLLSSRATGQLR